MKNWKLYAIGLGCLAFLVLACVAHDALILAYMAHDPYDRQEKIQTTLEWGRLAPFPDEISNFEIQTEGSTFTRGFRSSFKCPKDVLDKWIQESPGLKEAQVEMRGSIKRYEIHPGAGAGGARMDVNPKTDDVEVYVYWS